MSNLKKVLALALALAMVMTMFAGASIKTVLDVKDADQFTDAQLEAAGLLQPLGVLAGMGADELGAGKVTRPQMVAFIYRLTNGGDDGIDAYYSKTSQYKDVDTEAWYAPYLNWAYASKVAFGYTDGNFGVNDYVTGAQAAAMLVRLLGKEASGNDYALQAQSHAIALGIDDGITTKGLYENVLNRGDMFIMLANTLMCEVKDGKGNITTIAEKVFDLEIIEGAILLDVASIGKNDYSVFSFRIGTAGDVKYFKSGILCVEEDVDISEDIGCKYTLLVSKSQDVQGYRTLYAAYEEEDGKYYKVVTGTVDDGTLVFEKDATATKKQNVFYDDHCVFYVDEKVSDRATFEAAYGKANWGVYKLIDNDGDGKYEFAIIERLTYAQLGVKTVTAKVTAISAKGALTLTTEDGTVYAGLKYGTYASTNSNGTFKAWVDTTETIQYALGIKQPGYLPFTGISDVYYDFDIVYNTEKTAGYVFAVKVSEKTAFAGNYGIFVQWSSPVTMYKNMAYAQFVNEKNEYFWAYVSEVNENRTVYVGDPDLENTLVYFTDGDYSDDVVSFYTANYWNANQTYNWYEAFEWEYDVTTNKDVVFTENVVSELMAKETVNYSKLAKYGKILAVMDLDKDATGFEYWNTWTQKYVFVNKNDTIEMSNRKITVDGTEYAVEDYKSIQGYRFYKVSDSHEFYGIEDIDECVGFVFLTDADITITLDVDPFDGESFQIYMANGFWHLRNYVSVDEDDIKPTIMWGKFKLVQGRDVPGVQTDNMADVWGIVLPDGTDPGEDFSGAEFVPMYEIIKGFDDTIFSEKVAEYIASLKKNASGDIRSAYTLLNANNGVVFAYGATVMNGMKRWVAFNADTFNSRFFADETDDPEFEDDVHDELIYTVLGGKTYVKAMKITAEDINLLPYGWIGNDGYELVVFAGFTGAVNTNGWQIEVLTLSAEGVKSEKIYTRIGMGGADEGDLLLIKKDAEGFVTEITAVGGDITGYLDYIEGLGNIIFAGSGTISSATSFWGEDFRGNYYEVKLDTKKTVVYVEIDDGADNVDGTSDDVYVGYSNEYKKDYKDCAGFALETTNFILVAVYVK